MSRDGLRILFVNRMAAMERGGGETFDLEIARHLAALGGEVTFLAGRPVFRGARLKIQNLPFVLLRSPYWGWFPWDKVKGGWRLRVADFTWFEWRAATWIERHSSQFDIVQLCELPNVVAFCKSRNSSARRPRFVVRLTAPNYYDPRGGIEMADGLIASGTTVAKLRARGETRVEDVPNAVDTDRFRPHQSSFRSTLGISPSAFVLLYVARFQDFKNHGLLLRAFDRIARQRPDAHLLLVGSGPLLMPTRRFAAALPCSDRIHFLGEVAYHDLPDIYATADVKVIASDYESFCFAALEAMATGLPIVTTDCGWVPGLIGDTLSPIDQQWVKGDRDPPSGRFSEERDGARIREAPGGFVTGRNDADSLAAAVLRLAIDPERRSRLGAWNREKAVREHGWRSSAEALMNYYRRVLAA